MNNTQQKQYENRFINTVYDELQLRGSYILLLVSSSIIATLGLLINSSAVVIGAMLISPVFWPIMGVTISLITTRRQMARKAIFSLVLSVVVILLVSMLVSWLVPFTGMTDQIRERIQPTLLDLGIALASSVIGVAALYYPRISQTATGVAISVALLPALCVSGIGISQWSWNVFSGSLLLFSSNVAAIIFAGIITLYILDLRPRFKDEATRLKIGFAAVFFFVLVLSVPLFIYLRNSLELNTIQRTVNTVLVAEVSGISESARVDELRVEYVPSLDDIVHVTSTVYLPEGVYVTVKQQNAIIERLVEETGQSIDLQLNVVNTLVLRQEEDQELQDRRADIREFIQDELARMNEDIIVEQIDVDFVGESIETHVTLRQFETLPLTFEQKNQLEQSIEGFTSQSAQVEVEFIAAARLDEPDEQLKLQQRLETVLVQDMRTIDTRIVLQNVTFSTNQKKKKDILQVSAQIFVPVGVDITTDQQAEVENHLQQEADGGVELILGIVRVEPVNEIINTEEAGE